MRDLYFASCSDNGGIYHYKVEKDNFKFCEKYECKKPMYLAIENNKIYALLKKPKNDENSYCFDLDLLEDGGFGNSSNLINTKGVVACHLFVQNNNVYAVNYLSGNVVKLPSGKVSTHSGKGENIKRQEAPHTHFVTNTPDDKFICVTDLGLDKIFVYDKELKLISSAEVPKGYGCRHLVFNGNICYCVNELQSSVSVFRYNNGKLLYLKTYNALPNDYKGNNLAAAIRINNDYLYISNRGHNSIACFKIAGEELELLSFTDCNGNGPRDINIFDNIMYVTNELSNNVTVFKVNGEKLIKLDVEFEMPRPICVISK